MNSRINSIGRKIRARIAARLALDKKQSAIVFVTRTLAKVEGFTFAGVTADSTMLADIQRDYIALGYRVVFVKVSPLSDTVEYWAKPEQTVVY